MLLLCFGIMVMLTSQNLEVYSLFHSFFWKTCEGLVFYFRILVELTSESIWFWSFLCWDFDYWFHSNGYWLLVRALFRFSVSSWVNLGSLCVFRNLFISSRLCGLLIYYDYSQYCLNPFYFSKISSNYALSLLILVSCVFSLFSYST